MKKPTTHRPLRDLPFLLLIRGTRNHLSINNQNPVEGKSGMFLLFYTACNHDRLIAGLKNSAGLIIEFPDARSKL